MSFIVLCTVFAHLQYIHAGLQSEFTGIKQSFQTAILSDYSARFMNYK